KSNTVAASNARPGLMKLFALSPISIFSLLIFALSVQSRVAVAQEKAKSGTVPAQAISPLTSEEFLRSVDEYLGLVRQQMVDPAFPLDRREAIASETLAMLRSRIGEAPAPDDALKVWAQLIDVAESFSRKHPRHPMEERFRLTQAEAWWQRSRLNSRMQAVRNPASPTDSARPDREKAITMLRESIKTIGQGNDPQSQMSRYLLAQCLADQVVATPTSPQVAQWRNEILALTEKLDNESISDWALIMRARALSETGRDLESLSVLEKTTPAFRHRYASAWADVKIAVFIKLKKWQEAEAFLRSTDLPDSLAGRLEIDLWAHRWKENLTDSEKTEIQNKTFAALIKIRQATDTDAIGARKILALSGITPPENAESLWWVALAEALLFQGQDEKGARALDTATQRAHAENSLANAAKYEYQAGAAWYKAGQFNTAQARMLDVISQAEPTPVGPRASLLRVMSLKAMGLSGRAMLAEAIAMHMERYAEDELTTGEVLWIEGETKAASGDKEGAIEAWGEIPANHPRWLAANLASARIDLEQLETLVLVGDNKAFARRWDVARKRLELARDEALAPADKITIDLYICRIDLTPGSERVDNARQACLRLQPRLTRESQRQLYSAVMIMTDALLGRTLDLEAQLKARDQQMDDSLVLDMCRVLDISAAIIDTEPTRKQLGSAMARLSESLPSADHKKPTEVNQELELRKIRGLIYAGQPTAAEPRLDAWMKANPDVSPTLLYAISDALLRLNATSKAISYLTRWVGQETEGEIPWFLGRLELAKALYREGRDDEARRLIDATLVLYPEAGGPGLKRRYERLRSSIREI
ncbi:MAG: tetratricopeptide repeat protein, partial [bacterium]